MSNKIKILYVDDEEINVTLFKINFSKYYHVITGSSGFDGLDLLVKNRDTKIVISDMKMPKMNGIEFMNKAKSQFPEIKYFILTGFEINDEIQDAIDNGLIIRYFRKPLNFNEIVTSINEAL